MERFISSKELEQYCRRLGDLLEGINFDVIAPLSRGGLIPGIVLSHRFCKNLIVISCTSYEGKRQKDILIEDIPLSRLKDTTLKSCSWAVRLEPIVLVVDDLTDSGNTLNAVCKLLKQANLEVITATLFVKGDTENTRSDYYVEVVPQEQWISFWYESN